MQYNIVRLDPSIFRALSPSYMRWYWSGRAGEAWRELGAVMLSITGAEALYADLGHFSRPAIQVGGTFPSKEAKKKASHGGGVGFTRAQTWAASPAQAPRWAGRHGLGGERKKS